MPSSSLTRFAAVAFAAALVSLAVAACDDDASPTTPAPAPPPAPAPAPPPEPEPDPIRAEEVVDRDTLRRFVEAAVGEASANIASADAAYDFFDTTFREERWLQGSIYLFSHYREGDLRAHLFFHGVTPENEGTDRWNLTDVNGVKLIQELLAAVADGGGYIEYRWPNPAVEGDEDTGSPKVSYGLPLTIGDLKLSVGAGIYTPVTAADVLNRGNLMQFVERAAAALSEHTADRETAYAFLDENFRSEGEWRSGEIYVFVLTMEGVNFFQAPDPDWEGTDTSGIKDVKGVRLFDGILEAAQAGGGFTEYHWDNPAVEGDEEDGSPKLAYVFPVTIGGETMILGSGIYVDASEQ